MQFLAVWPGIGLIAALVLVAGMPRFAALDAVPGPPGGRLPTLDGLRGFLALGVCLHHAAIYHAWLTERRWALPPSWFYAPAGQIGVALFFMITGYLFWGKLIAEGGGIDWLRLYVGRVFRLGPVYLLATAGVVVVVLADAGWRSLEPARAWAHDLGQWLALGAVPGPALNADPLTGIALAGVTWTLRYEWLFYFNLPWLVVFVRSRGWHLGASVAGLALALLATQGRFASIIAPNEAAIASLFGFGMLTASLHDCGWRRLGLPDVLASALALVLLGLAFAAGVPTYTVRPMLLLGAAFYLLASGATLFGLLLTPGAQRLGHISYGIYLLQGLALMAVFAPRPLRDFALASPPGYWVVIGLAVALLAGTAALAHVLIERPGMALGRSFATVLLGRRAAGTSRNPKRLISRTAHQAQP